MLEDWQRSQWGWNRVTGDRVWKKSDKLRREELDHGGIYMITCHDLDLDTAEMRADLNGAGT